MIKFDGFPHVVASQQFSVESLTSIFQVAREMEFVAAYAKDYSHGQCGVLAGRKMINLFYEPSTRTRISFEMAMSYLGGRNFSTENAKDFSSAIKGERLEDTIRVLCRYKPDVIVLRHHEDESAQKAADVSCVPIINAGNGRGQHPTQSILDLYTIQKKLGHIEGLTVAMVGDLVNGRTVRSLSYFLGKFRGIKIYFVSPECARMRDDIKEYLLRHQVEFHEVGDLRDVASQADVIYQTRVQKERGTSFENVNGSFTVDQHILSLMKEKSIIMHPLPRVNEITPEVDSDPRAVYFEQAENGLYVRMALLKVILAPNDSTWLTGYVS